MLDSKNMDCHDLLCKSRNDGVEDFELVLESRAVDSLFVIESKRLDSKNMDCYDFVNARLTMIMWIDCNVSL